MEVALNVCVCVQVEAVCEKSGASHIEANTESNRQRSPSDEELTAVFVRRHYSFPSFAFFSDSYG